MPNRRVDEVALSGSQDQFENKFGVFVSHSTADQDIADTVVSFIHDVGAGRIRCVQSTSSELDIGIPTGTEWFQWIKRHISGCRIVVAILTRESVARPWILFESGFAKASEEKVIYALAVGQPKADALKGPFGIFQGLNADRSDLTKLARELQRAVGLSQSEKIVGTYVEGLMDDLDGVLGSAERSNAEAIGNDPVSLAIASFDQRLSAIERGVGRLLSDARAARKDHAEMSISHEERTNLLRSLLGQMVIDGESDEPG